MDSGLDPSHIHLKPLSPVGHGQGQGQEGSYCIGEVSSNLTYTLPLLGESPEDTRIIKGLGMSGPLPDFWCQLALVGSCDFLFSFSQN